MKIRDVWVLEYRCCKGELQIFSSRAKAMLKVNRDLFGESGLNMVESDKNVFVKINDVEVGSIIKHKLN